MAQAKTLTQVEIDQVLRYASTRQYPERNRALILTSFYLGLRVAEISLLKRGDIVNDDGSIKNEIRLSASQTKACFLFTKGLKNGSSKNIYHCRTRSSFTLCLY